MHLFDRRINIKPKLFQYLLGFLFILPGVVALIFRVETNYVVLHFATHLFSADGQLSEANLHLINESVLLMSGLLIAIGSIYIFYGWKPFSTFFIIFRQAIRTDRNLSNIQNTRIIPLLLWGSSILSIIIVGIKAFEGKWGLQALYGEDRLMENISFLMILAAAILLTAAAMRSPRGRMRVFFITGSVILVIIALEEISYGQRIFGWDTPEFLMGRNIQDETNIHNFFNYQFKALYALLSLILLPLTVSVYLHSRPQKYPLLEMALPHPSLFSPCLMIAFFALVAGFDMQELLEELLAALFLFYAIQARLLSYQNAPSQGTPIPEKKT